MLFDLPTSIPLMPTNVPPSGWPHVESIEAEINAIRMEIHSLNRKKADLLAHEGRTSG